MGSLPQSWSVALVDPTPDRSSLPPVLIRLATIGDAEAIARVNGESWTAAYGDILPPQLLEPEFLNGRAGMWQTILGSTTPLRMLLVAETEDGDIIGFISAGRPRVKGTDYQSEVYALYVLPGYWRSGLGLRLVAAAATRLDLFGRPSLMLWTLENNARARSFYEKLGGRLFGSRVETIGAVPLTEVGYGWPDIEELIETCAEQARSRHAPSRSLE